MYKRFTLIEVIATIVILSILLSIVMIKTLDFKKQSIYASVAQNTRILQGSVDQYFLKNEKYPVKNFEELSIYAPQEVNIDLLVKEGFLKKELDTSKVKEQYYWIDVFGKVWGNTLKEPINVNQLGTEDLKQIEFVLSENVEKYNLYEVNGYNNLSYKQESLWTADSNPLEKRVYKIVDEVKVKGGNKKVVNFNLLNNNSDYLVSTIDEFGLEGPPFGKYAYTGDGSPSFIKKEGVYEFEIESMELMYWIDFLYAIDTPGESTVSFDFKIKNKEGIYQDWTSDFYNLDPSEAITVRVDMKGDDKGNKPSLYYSRVLFKYLDEEVVPPVKRVNPEINVEPADSCPKVDFKTTLSLTNNEKGTGTIGYYFEIHPLEDFSESLVPNVQFSQNAIYNVLDKKVYISKGGQPYTLYNGENASGECMYVLYNVEILSIDVIVDEREKICGVGGTRSSHNIKDKGKIVYDLYLSNGQKMSDIKVYQSLSSYEILNVYYEYSHKGVAYEVVSSMLDIPSESCVNIVYEVSAIKCKDCGYPPPPKVETCKEKGDCPKLCGENCQPTGEGCKVSCSEIKEDWCDTNPCDGTPICIEYNGGCEPPVCTSNCSPLPPTEPDPKDPKLNDPEWTTVDKLTFYGHGAYGQLVRWYKVEHNQSKEDDEITRIVYRYAKTNAYHWSNEYDDFEKTGIATSVMARAYIQVRTKELSNVKEEDYPEVVSMKFYNEKGVLDMSLIQPTLSIVPLKDNNGNREVFSNTSNIEWTYIAADPRNKKIVDVEWAGDIRENYPVGEYSIQARVKNEVAIWSEWVPYKLKVLEEKPVAVIKMRTSGHANFVSHKDNLTFSMAESYDPDGDKIVDYEWKNKKTSYDIGKHIVSLRVKDEEGYWSNWTEHEVNVGEAGMKVYRLEAEDYKFRQFNYSGVFVTEDTEASNGKNLEFGRASNYIEFTFEGTGFDISWAYVRHLKLYIDGEEYSFSQNEFQKDLYVMRNLENKEHKVQILRTASSDDIGRVAVDYIDIYSSKTEPNILDITSNVKYKNGTVFDIPSNNFSIHNEDQLQIEWIVEKDSVVTTSIVNKDGSLVKSLRTNQSLKGGTYGTYLDFWNGYNNAGEKVATGSYYFKVEAIGVDGKTKSTRQYEVNTDNNIPIYRLEAEQFKNDERIYASGMTAVTVEGASNGGKARTGVAGSYVQFTFEGTGFDLIYDPKPYTKVTLEGYPEYSKSVTTGDSNLYSVRNLAYKTHVLTVYNGSSGVGALVDYIDVYSTNYTPNVKDFVSKIKFSDGSMSNYETIDFSLFSQQKISVDYRTYKDQYTTAEVIDSKGSLVKTLFGNKFHIGGSNNFYNVIWDGSNNSNDSVETGEYTIRYTSTGLDKTSKSTTTYKVRLENEKPIYRFEAEGNHPNVIHSGRAVSGEVATITRAGSYIEFKFIGTGFDLKWLPKAYSYLQIDDNPRENHSAASSTLISIRNLELKEHTVRVSNGTSGSTMNIDYLDVFSSDYTPIVKDIYSNYIEKSTGFLSKFPSNSFSSEKGQKINVTVPSHVDAFTTVTVKNKKGVIVKTLGSNEFWKGGTSYSHNVIWDGTNNSGEFVETGFYTYEIVQKSILGGKTKTFTYEVYADSSEADIRLEAENVDGQLIKASSNTVVNDEEARGGKKAYLSTNARYVTFTFTGTGFDLKLDPNRYTKITIVGMSDEHSFSYGTDKNRHKELSFRNLPEREYVVTIMRTSSGSEGNTYIDYLDVYK